MRKPPDTDEVLAKITGQNESETIKALSEVVKELKAIQSLLREDLKWRYPIHYGKKEVR
jgi:hypothetical protein